MKVKTCQIALPAAGIMIFLTGCAGAQNEENGTSKGTMGRYREMSLDAPGDHGSVGLLKELEDGRIAFLDNVDGLFLSDDGGVSFERSQEQMKILRSFQDEDRIAVSPDGQIIYAKSKQGSGFTLQAGREEGGIRIWFEGEGRLLQLAFGPDHMLYAAVSRDGLYRKESFPRNRE